MDDKAGEPVWDALNLYAVCLELREEDLLVELNVVQDLPAIHEPGQLENDEVRWRAECTRNWLSASVVYLLLQSALS